MHLLAPTKRSAFNIEEKRHIEERHISPVHLIVLITQSQIPSLLSTEGLTAPSCQRPCAGGDIQVQLQPIRCVCIDASEKWTNSQRREILSRAGL